MILSVILLLAIFVAIFWAVANHRRYKLNLLVAEDLDTIINSTLEVVRQNKKFAQENTQRISRPAGAKGADLYDINSPTMLSTLITCLVNKFGDTRLSLKDFSIPDDEYVSVYVDTTTQEIILSLNHHYAGDVEESYPLLKFPDPDDSTFH